MTSRIKPLTSGEASKTLAHRMTGLADKIRQKNTCFGLRSKRVFLVWSEWTGEERGEGEERLLAEIELLPTPRVSEMSAIANRPYSIGTFPEGSLRVDQISAGAYTEDMLRGIAIPDSRPNACRRVESSSPNGNNVERASSPKVDFWYEIQEDGRGDNPARRQRFRVYGNPARNEARLEWAVILERADEPRSREGQFQIGVNATELPED